MGLLAFNSPFCVSLSPKKRIAQSPLAFLMSAKGTGPDAIPGCSGFH